MSISLNYTSFANAKVAHLVLDAMTTVQKTGDAVRLSNRNGKHWLLVTLHKDALGYTYRFIDTDGNDVGQMILKAAVKCWGDAQAMTFWHTLCSAYDLKEHPIVTLAKKHEERRMAVHKARMYGATHDACLLGGRKVFVAVKRNWLGLKRYHVVTEAGVWVKMTPEYAACITWLEELL